MQLHLRPWQIEDAAPLAQLADNPQIARYMSDSFPSPYTLKDAQAFILQCLAAPEQEQLARAITVDDQVAGSIALLRGSDVYRCTAQIAYWLAEPYWGQGIMTRAIHRICEDAFDHYQDLVRISAEPFEANLPSCKALERAGFRLEGLLINRVYKNGWVGNAKLYALTR